MRALIVYAFLRFLKTLSRVFYRYEWHWVGDVPERPWSDFRLVAILNHTSLFEFLLAGGVPNSFLRRMAAHGVVPIAEKTMKRPLIGWFWRLIAGDVVSISRERDETWEQVLSTISPDSMVIILPEGRMKRADGRDSHGREMTIRGGIADIMETIPEGRLLMAYSEGLHHIQVPGQRFPKLFKTIRMRLESVDIAAFREEHQAGSDGRKRAFRRATIANLTVRRDRYCASDVDLSDAQPDRH